jgi:hypothetical protein
MAHQAQTELKVIITQATCLARKGTARCWRQLRTMGPKRGCASIQASARALLREKQKAASSTKGVVGKTRQEDADDARGQRQRAGRAPQHPLPVRAEVVTLIGRQEYWWAMGAASVHLVGSLMLTAVGILVANALFVRA